MMLTKKRNRGGIVLATMMMLFAAMADAEWVRVTGEAVVRGGDVATARKEAQKDAIRQASLQFGASISSQDTVEQGLLTESTIKVSSDSYARRIVPVSEEIFDDTLQLTLDLDMQARKSELCEGMETNKYRRHVALLGFAMEDQTQADIGGLYNIERELPTALNGMLVNSPRLLVSQASHIQLYHELVNAPTHETEQRTLTKAVDEARKLGVQFVVSGVVRDLSVRSPDAYERSIVKNVSRWLTLSDLERAFVVDLFIHDGFSGAIMFEQRYSTMGEWDADPGQTRSLLSAEFRELEYGKKVANLLHQMASDIESNLSCQPFMTRITRVEGRNVLFEAGANSGIRPGDRFQIYRSRQLYDGTRFQGTHLADMKLALQVGLVQPELASGNLSLDPTRINIQVDDVVVSW
ncbi:flagella assembly protein FlgT [Hahella ganghwensis]|uniref:flagella assembly protein FlgT n=1 Tax=Hahella ganghwensis TaxID=286420 RepID=UPI0003A6B723|nr:flagella assembly protein FlgT [Hahella ganghwensis]